MPESRHVSRRMQREIKYGSGCLLVGVPVLLLGLGLLILLVFRTDLEGPFLFGEGSTVTTGTIERITQSSHTVNDQHYYHIKYIYSDESGQEFEGLSYKIGSAPEPGSQVSVEYLAERPGISRIRGARFRLFSIYALIPPGVVLLLAAVLVIPGLSIGMKRLNALKYWTLTTGFVTDKKRTNTNRKSDYLISISYAVSDGSTQVIKIRKTLDIAPAEGVPHSVLYDPLSPEKGILCDFAAFIKDGLVKEYEGLPIGLYNSAVLALAISGLLLTGIMRISTFGSGFAGFDLCAIPLFAGAIALFVINMCSLSKRNTLVLGISDKAAAAGAEAPKLTAELMEGIAPPPRLLPAPLSLKMLLGHPAFIAGQIALLLTLSLSLSPVKFFAIFFSMPAPFCLLVGLFYARRFRHLLKNGQMSLAVLSSMRKVTRDRSTFDELTFEFYTVSGHKEQLCFDTHDVNIYKQQKYLPLLYDEKKPRKAVLLKDIPCSPRISASGEISLGKYYRIYSIIPAVTIIMIIITVTAFVLQT